MRKFIILFFILTVISCNNKENTDDKKEKSLQTEADKKNEKTSAEATATTETALTTMTEEKIYTITIRVDRTKIKNIVRVASQEIFFELTEAKACIKIKESQFEKLKISVHSLIFSNDENIICENGNTNEDGTIKTDDDCGNAGNYELIVEYVVFARKNKIKPTASTNNSLVCKKLYI